MAGLRRQLPRAQVGHRPIEGRVEADDTVVGQVARAEDLDLTGLDTPVEDVREALAVNPAEFEAEFAEGEEYLKTLGDRIPKEIFDELEKSKAKI